MKKAILILFTIFSLHCIQAQDTVQHTLGDCIGSGKSLYELEMDDIFFNYNNDTLIITGLIGANCCGIHLALIEKMNDNIFINTVDTGELCMCSCLFNFELVLPIAANDSIVVLNSVIYNIKDIMGYKNNTLLFNESIVIYPNPSSGNFTIEVSDFAKNLPFEIFDIMGQKIKQGIITSCSQSIHFDKKGTYLVKFKESGKLHTKRIIIN